MRYSGKVSTFLTVPVRIILAIFIMVFLLVSSGCVSPGNRIHTESFEETDASGVFTLILYGGNYFDDLETVAFLDREGDAYTFDIYAPDFNYRAIKGVSAKEGLTKAKEFVSGNSAFHQVGLSSIVYDRSGIIGYEVRPLYLPFTYYTDDVLDIWYAAKENKIVVTIKLKPSVENMKMRDDFNAH